MMSKQNLALYIHLPFCKEFCFYCDFCRYHYDLLMADQYLVELKKEIASLDDSYQVKTIYLGGGTPSILSLQQMESLLLYLHRFLPVEEYTIELNPESITEEKIMLMKKYGINRFSIGMQVTQTNLLKSINRLHSFNDVVKTVALLKKHKLDNYSIDLMYGIPHQTLQDFENSLEAVLKLDPPHLSLYSLTIEENSVFGRRKVKAVDPELDADFYELAIKTLEDRGYLHYEISNFALKGFSSLHNQYYWKYQDFYGAGVSAASKLGNKRFLNTRDIKEYLKGKYLQEVTELSDKEQAFEYLMMNLRLESGFKIADFKKLPEANSYLNKINMNPLLKKFLINDGKTIKTTKRGMQILNDLLVELMDSE